MIVRTLAAATGLVLAVGVARVVTYEDVPPAPSALNLWGALLTARSARVTVTTGGVSANGVIEFAAQRTSLAVTSPVEYAEVADRAFTYVRVRGRWYRYLGGAGPSGAAFALVRLLSEADPLRYAGRAGGLTRWSRGELLVLVDAQGFPVRLEHRGVRVAFTDFFGPSAEPPPPRSTLVDGLDDALRAAS